MNLLDYYGGRKRITDPEEMRRVKERIADPDILTGKEGIYAIFLVAGIDLKDDEFFQSI